MARHRNVTRSDEPGAEASAAVTGEGAAILSTAPAGASERRLALAVAIVSLLVFLAMAPFAKQPLIPVWGFIPVYETALVVVDLMTAMLLLGQYRIGRARALLVLACGYFFTALIAVAHALTFPGLFAPSGLLGAGPQSTAWLYMFWHAGFPIFVIAYVLSNRGCSQVRAGTGPRFTVAVALALVLAVTAALTFLATAGASELPNIMNGNRANPTLKVVVTAVWLLSVLAVVVLWRRRPHSLIDVWLLVVMLAWVFDIALSAALNAGRFDLGFYGGRIYGLFASSFVLAMLIAENGMLYVKLMKAHDRAQQKANDARQLSAQLESANVTLGEQNRQLEEASRLKSEFLSNMSHELRTPLNAVIGFSEVMKDGLAGELTAQQGGYVGHIFQSGQHLLSLINDILDLSKIEAGKVEVNCETVDFDTLLTESMGLLSDRARAQMVHLRRESNQLLGSFIADRRRLRQILFNLISNAIKFTPANGQITLHSRLVDRAHAESALPGFGIGVRMPLPDNEYAQFVELSVVDTGIGIRPDDARKLFMPFTQIANQLTRQIEGTGLGLAMVKRLAELHGGTVAVTSESGRGSCFTVWLPWRPVGTDQPAAAAPVGAERAGAADAPLALVVEDDDEAAALMGLQLEA